MSPTVNCPTCQKSVEWNEQQKWRPFCSERCKLIDLGEWASESMRIPGTPATSWDDELHQLDTSGDDPQE